MGTPRAKGRPKHFDRDEALNSALRVFYENGYEATSVAQLGEAMNMKPPSLYNAFGDKEKLFIEVLEHYHRPYRESVSQIFSRAQTTQETIRQLMEMAKTMHGSNNAIGCLVANSTVNVGTVDSPIAEKIKSLHETTEKMIAQRLREGQKKGDISPEVKVTGLARYISGILLGAAALARGQKSPAAVKDLLDHGYQGFLRLARPEQP